MKGKEIEQMTKGKEALSIFVDFKRANGYQIKKIKGQIVDIEIHVHV